jgi:hypothetical protein
MIIGTVTVTKSMVLAALAVVSFLLAIVGLLATYGFGIPTPGAWVAWLPVSRGDGYSSLLAAPALQVAVDWLFCFALMCTVYFLRTRRRSKALEDGLHNSSYL